MASTSTTMRQKKTAYVMLAWWCFAALTVGRAQFPEVTISKDSSGWTLLRHGEPTLCWVRGPRPTSSCFSLQAPIPFGFGAPTNRPFGFCACPRDVGHAGVVFEA